MAKELNISREDGLFAATPPLEGLKYLISNAASVDGGDPTTGPCATQVGVKAGLCAKGEKGVG